MTINREKVIKALEKCKRCDCDDCTEEHASHCPWDCIAYDELVSLALSMLKEQEAVVRCKDCKHRPVKPDDYETGFDLEFPNGKCPCQCDDGYYSWYPNDNWFCADGERRTSDV